MKCSEPLGELEQLVLLACLRLGSQAYGVTIRHEIQDRAGRAVARGAVYVTLERLEAKGYLTSRVGEPVPERGGRPRRYYAVSAGSIGALASSRQSLLRMWSGLEKVLISR